MAFGDQDASGPVFVKANVAGKNVTTGSFTPPSGALLIAFAWHDTAGGNLTNTSVVTDSLGLTWTRRATRSKQDDGAGAANGHIAISTAVATGAAMTVTTTGTNTGNPAGLYVRVIPGADTTTPMDATPVEGTTNAAVVSTSIVTATDGARCFLQVIDWNVAAAMTAGTGQTSVVSDAIGASDDRVYLGVTNAVTSPAGSTALSTGSPSTGNTNNWIGIAVRPAAGGGSVSGTAAATLGALAAGAAGTHIVSGTAAGALGVLAATASSTRAVQGTAAAALGHTTAAAAGTRTTAGTAAAALGTLAVTVIGRRTVLGAAAAPLGGATGHGDAGGAKSGSAVAALGVLAATIAGRRTVAGIAAAVLPGVTSPGSGRRIVVGSPQSMLGGLSARVVVISSTALAGNAHGPLPVAPGAVTVHTVSIAGAIT